MLLDRAQDPLGKAIYDTFTTGKESVIRVDTNITEDEELLGTYFLRKYKQMPIMEQEALKLAKGKVLDAGAGAGCHAVYLQEKGVDVTACEISPWCIDILEKRNVNNIFQGSLTEVKEIYDTILLLMNGIGMVENMNGLKGFFEFVKSILKPTGQVLIDSSDIIYMFMEEDGSVELDLSAGYYGEMTYELTYQDVKSGEFPWVYIGYDVLEMYAEESGLKCEKVLDGEHYDYLAKVTF